MARFGQVMELLVVEPSQVVVVVAVVEEVVGEVVAVAQPGGESNLFEAQGCRLHFLVGSPVPCRQSCYRCCELETMRTEGNANLIYLQMHLEHEELV